jgi:hypothetical protein
MLAGGAACCIGDQLHPRGRLNPETYRRIGATYAAVAAKEAWCTAAEPLVDIGVLLTPEADSGTQMAGLESEQGATRLLLELGTQFHLIDRLADFTSYRLVIAPDSVRLDHDLAARLRAYVAQGGSLLLSHASGLATDGPGFALDAEMGLDYLGPRRDDVEFLRPVNGLDTAIPAMDHALYLRGSAVRAARYGRPWSARLALLLPHLGPFQLTRPDTSEPGGPDRPGHRDRTWAGGLPVTPHIPCLSPPWLLGVPPDRGGAVAPPAARAAGTGECAHHRRGNPAAPARG